MRKLVLTLLISTQALATSVPEDDKPIVVLGHFDAFGSARFNNSTNVALEILAKNKDHPDYDLRLCPLKTVFDKSFYQMEDCLKALPKAPKLVLGLGEGNCNLKIETMARNLDHTKGPDNDGIERKKEVIIPGAPNTLGLNYPLPQMYCTLDSTDRKALEVSNNAGTFVCNNLAYQFSYQYQDIIFGFIHVPAHNCRNLNKRSQLAVSNLSKMIEAAVKTTPVGRLMTNSLELQELRRQHQDNECLSEFYARTKGADEKRNSPF